MAPPRAAMQPTKPSPSPSSSGFSSTSSEEEEKPQAQASFLSPPGKKPLTAAAPPPLPPSSLRSGSDEEDEEEEEDGDGDGVEYEPPPRPQKAARPTLSESESESDSDAVVPPPAGGRKMEEPEVKEEEEEGGARVWKQEDEIALLKGMAEFQAENGGADPSSAVDAFQDLLRRRSMRLEFSRSQLADKMRRLRRKYEVNLLRGKKGSGPSFSRAHDIAAFELSKTIWPGRRGRATRLSPWGEGSPAGKWMWSALQCLKPATARALEERWRRHFIAGMKLRLERYDLTKELLGAIVGQP
ncbi:unnamed protein product [Spirodela intermedia]|uniref:Glabrous enhancer-binding protein-like DBD domain-containing protein n=1 Tax=Spirodela intermedia TaxID=51605 RepID=A0A7I8JQ77_SPIIN|nr:unnamed protein product [Spirodela intermedia]CAA6671911.1 unnamed protein product [Spirodela intermedia]